MKKIKVLIFIAILSPCVALADFPKGMRDYTNTEYSVDHSGHSAGTWSGFGISDSGSGEIDVAAGVGIIKATDSATAKNAYFTYAGETDIALTDNSTNWIYIDYNSGTPIAAADVDITNVDKRTEIVIGRVYRSGTDLNIISVGQQFQDYQAVMCIRDFEIHGFERASGEIIGETGTRNIVVSAGVNYCAHNRFITAAFDSSGANTFSTWYYNGSSWVETATQTQIDNVYYNNTASGLVELTANRYAVHWIFRGYDGTIDVIYGQGDYTLANADAANVPAELPDLIENFHFIIGKIIVKKNAATFTDCLSAFDTQFNFTPITDHGDLTGLTDDDHTQYLLVAGTRELTGNWDAGAFEIRAETFESDVAIGTAPFTITSTTVSTNLNADLLDGETGSFYLDLGNTTGTLAVARGGTNSSTALNNGRVIISDSGAIVESATITTTELGLLNGMASVSTGAGDNDKLVTQGYVDDGLAGQDSHTELSDLAWTSSAHTGGNSSLAGFGAAGAATEIDTKAELEGQMSDVSDFAEADGDTWTGVHDAGGATSLEIPNSADPTTDAAGEMAWDSDDYAIEVYGPQSRLIPTLYTVQVTIYDPDTIQATEDALPVLNVRAEVFPHGITIVDCGFALDQDATYTLVFEEWTDPVTYGSDIESITASSADEAEDDGTLSDASIAAGSFVFVDLPDTDVNWLQVWFTYFINPGN